MIWIVIEKVYARGFGWEVHLKRAGIIFPYLPSQKTYNADNQTAGIIFLFIQTKTIRVTWEEYDSKPKCNRAYIDRVWHYPVRGQSTAHIELVGSGTLSTTYAPAAAAAVFNVLHCSENGTTTDQNNHMQPSDVTTLVISRGLTVESIRTSLMENCPGPYKVRSVCGFGLFFNLNRILKPARPKIYHLP
jgi:hypothetical protein